MGLSYLANIFLKVNSIKVKPMKFGQPNKQVLALTECVLIKIPKGWAIYSPTFVALFSFRMAELLTKRLGIKIHDFSLDDI